MRRLHHHVHHLDFPEHPVHAEAWAARNKYSAALNEAKQKHWTNWLENATELDIWAAHHYLARPTGDGGLSSIPALKRGTGDGGIALATTNKEKALLLAKVFFLLPPPDPLPGAD